MRSRPLRCAVCIALAAAKANGFVHSRREGWEALAGSKSSDQVCAPAAKALVKMLVHATIHQCLVEQ
jgi:hypothetical protein